MSTNKKSHIVFIGMPIVGEALANIMKDAWNIHTSYKNVHDFIDQLRDEAVPAFDGIAIMDQGNFDTTAHDTTFETFIASVAPQAFVAIINYNTDIRSMIRERLNTTQQEYNVAKSKYYFIEAKRPRLALEAAIADYSPAMAEEIFAPQYSNVLHVMDNRIAAAKRS